MMSFLVREGAACDMQKWETRWWWRDAGEWGDESQLINYSETALSSRCKQTTMHLHPSLSLSAKKNKQKEVAVVKELLRKTLRTDRTTAQGMVSKGFLSNLKCDLPPMPPLQWYMPLMAHVDTFSVVRIRVHPGTWCILNGVEDSVSDSPQSRLLDWHGSRSSSELVSFRLK